MNTINHISTSGVNGNPENPKSSPVAPIAIIGAACRYMYPGTGSTEYGLWKMLREAYHKAGLDPRDTLYVESHGTGTEAGDGCEIQAFSEAMGGKSRCEKIFVGTIKANVGHLENASGLAGVMKALLMLERGFIVPSPTFESPNESLELKARGIEVGVL
ncbi:hypothetical protein CDD80_5180 [Ophiocordyceps camponoti-rufipedis]|uniref:Ketosynthase family 3 (KS3) domain-containing protein n=1 Tax=Ophiocordyceps camponoti-rufipedis TaxID=2004952 RepID=A0A2C5ZME1_9HYPO|nr:hypothetical protein CDD80_5180 [Ophiocordyceps camponoti-rufipedis]